MSIGTVEEAIKQLKLGNAVIVVDDEDRENEGDFVVAAERCTPEMMNFFISQGKGIPCVATTQQRLEELNLPMMVTQNTARRGTAMTVTVDATAGTTGISAYDRALTVSVFVNPAAQPSDLMRPGHIFPLRAVEGGVLKRAGHTEATVDLCQLAGFQPTGVCCEIVGDDGSMALLPELEKMAEKFGMVIITVADLIAYRRRTERLITRVASTSLPTGKYGDFTVYAYEASVEPYQAMALVKGDVTSDDNPPLVRVHSSCVTGDLLDSLRCDCGDQLHLALQRITDEGRGVLIYLEQEGRGIGLINKLKAYALQDAGADTVQANEMLGFKADLRDYGIGAQIMADIGLKSIRFMTNNPRKVAGLEGYGITIVDHVPVQIEPNPHNSRYLETKRDKMGHLLGGSTDSQQ